MKFWVCAACLVAMLASGCGSDNTIVPVNHAPTISFTFVPLGVPASVPVNLTVSVNDEDGDALTVTWDITNGTLTPKNAAKTVMEWAVPDQLGVESVTVTVTDGEKTKSITRELKIGTRVLENGLAEYTLAESPYILRPTNQPPQVLIGSSTIEAGVEILVDVPETIIDVANHLNIMGTAAKPVVIRPNDRGQLCQTNRSWWNGIFVGGATGVLTMHHAEIWNAKNGIRLVESGVATVDSSLFSCCGDNAILMNGAGSLVVTDCEISNTETNGITLSTITFKPQLVSVTGCNISINGGAGISMDLEDQLHQVPITISRNRFEFNFTHGITMTNWVWPAIHDNSFYSNGDLGRSNIRLIADFHDASHPDSLDVSCNYWGAVITKQSDIEGTVYDLVDSPSLGTRLLVAPWRNSDPYQDASPPACP